MFNKIYIVLISTLALALPLTPFAQEEEMNKEIEEEMRIDRGANYKEKKKMRKSVSAQAKFTSDYVFRGIPQRGNSIQGSLHYKPFMQGFFATLWAGNNPMINSPEGRLTLGVKLKHHETKLAFWLKATRYNFIREPRNDMNEYNIGLSWNKSIFLNVDYTDEWRSLTSSNLHIGLKAKYKLQRKLKLLLKAGYNIVDDENIFGYTDYLYYGIGLGVHKKGIMYAIQWSDTDRDLKSSGVKTSAKDSSLRFSLTKYF